MHSPLPVVVAIIIAVSSSVLAQQAQQIGANVGQSPAPAGPANGPAIPLLRSNANLVLVDVVVTDRNGAVHGLEQKRFHVFEDGHEQNVTTFDEHRALDTNSPSTHPEAKAAALPPRTYTNAPIYPPSSAANVLLLDGLNTLMPDQVNARRQMLQYLAKLEPGTTLAIFTLSSRLRMVSSFTSNPAELTRAFNNPKGGPQQSAVLDPASDQALDSSIADMASMGASSDAINIMQQFQADLTAFQTDQRVQMTLDAMQQLARYLAAVPGRKNLIWFSGSFPISLDPDDSLQSPFEAMRNYADQIQETSEMLSAARVAVYPVDARGLMTLPSADASRSPSTNLMGGGTSKRRGRSVVSSPRNSPSPNKDDIKFLQQTMAEHATMEQIADATGGKLYINTNGLKEAVADAVANGASYYTVGYVPAAGNLNGQFRKIKVRLDNSDSKLAFRNGYYADSGLTPSPHKPTQASLIASATLHGAPLSTQIIFRARVLPADDPIFKNAKLPQGPAGEMSAAMKAPFHRYVVDLATDAHGLAFETQNDGSHRAYLEFTVVAYDADGKRVNYFDRGIQLSLKPEYYANMMSSGVPFRVALDLPSGQNSLRVAVHDLAADKAGSLEIPVTVAR